jgi:hypothetical protein
MRVPRSGGEGGRNYARSGIRLGAGGRQTGAVSGWDVEAGREDRAPAPRVVDPASEGSPVGTDTARFLALQGSAGNRATAGLIVARQSLDAGTPAPAPAGDFNASVAHGDYDAAVRALDALGDDDQNARLRVLPVDQLSRLADAARRVFRDPTNRTTRNVEHWEMEVGERTRFRQRFDAFVAAGSWDEAAGAAMPAFENSATRRTALAGLSRDAVRNLSAAAGRLGPPGLEVFQDCEFVRVAQLEADYNAAVGHDWVQAATLLNAYNDHDLDIKIGLLTPDHKVQMMAGARQASAIGTGDRIISRLHTSTGRAQGAIFGTVTTSQQPEPGLAGGGYAFVFRITFHPDPSVVNATKIGFVQTSRVVQPGTNTNKEYMEPQNSRRNANQEAIDRVPGRKFGYYGMNNDRSPGGNVTFGSAPATPTDATFYDRPSDAMLNVSFNFETAVVAIEGAQANLVYSVVHWGFDVDGSGNLTAHPVTVEDRPTAGLATAAQAWNTQAAGPAAGRNDPNQQALPAFR